jgi:hypothetical protein
LASLQVRHEELAQRMVAIDERLAQLRARRADLDSHAGGGQRLAAADVAVARQWQIAAARHAESATAYSAQAHRTAAELHLLIAAQRGDATADHRVQAEHHHVLAAEDDLLLIRQRQQGRLTQS